MTPLAGPRSLRSDTAGQAVTKGVLYAVAATALVWPAVFGRSPMTLALLANRPMRYLGDISYGMFLYHLLVLDTVMRLLGYAVFTGQVIQVFPLTAAGAAVLAALSFRFLERPFIRLGHRKRDSDGGQATALSEARAGGIPG
jgi:peptidoglycan/LPS O-acetylase OafA/YrhL